MLPTKILSQMTFWFRRSKKTDFQVCRHGGHLASPIGTILAIDLQVAPMLPTQLQVNWPFYSEKSKNRFSRWPPLGFQIGTISAIFELQVTPMLPTKFRVIWPFASGEETKIYFQAGRYCGHLGFSIGTILAIFIYVTPMLPTELPVNWPMGSGEAKNRFSRWPPWRPSWNTDRNYFSYFWSTSHRYAYYQVSGQLAVWFRKSEIDFQEGRHGGHLEFRIGTILAIFDLQVTQMLPNKFRASWPFGSAEAKNRFKVAPMVAILDFPLERF